MAENRLDLNSFPTIIDVPREETASLLAKVLGITSLGFLITAVGVATAPPWRTFVGIIAVSRSSSASTSLARPIRPLRSASFSPLPTSWAGRSAR